MKNTRKTSPKARRAQIEKRLDPLLTLPKEFHTAPRPIVLKPYAGIVGRVPKYDHKVRWCASVKRWIMKERGVCLTLAAAVDLVNHFLPDDAPLVTSTLRKRCRASLHMTWDRIGTPYDKTDEKADGLPMAQVVEWLEAKGAFEPVEELQAVRVSKILRDMNKTL